MKCFVHNDREAEGACVYCGRLFCKDCLVELYEKLYCREHLDAAVDKIKKEFIDDYIKEQNYPQKYKNTQEDIFFKDDVEEDTVENSLNASSIVFLLVLVLTGIIFFYNGVSNKNSMICFLGFMTLSIISIAVYKIYKKTP